MESPHLLSTVHDLAICTRSVQSSNKRRFHHYDSDCCFSNTEPSFHTDRIDPRCSLTLAALAPASHTSSTSVCRFHACIAPVPSLCRSLASANHTSSINVCKSLASANHTSSIPCSCPDLGYTAWCSSSFHLMSPRSILVGLLLLTAVI